MRGKLGESKALAEQERITPADAGKTKRKCLTKLTKRDHPRGCGENSFSRTEVRLLIGSPPRMRGKPWYERYIAGISRITPADAGKTLEFLDSRIDI